MLYRPLGAAGLTVSEIGLGCASYWGRRAFDERQAHRVVHAALDGGVTFFDTGASYSQGEAEPRLGRALKGRDVSRLVVATKAGTRFEGGRIVRAMTPEGVTRTAEESLRRLGLDTIAVLQLHGPSRQELTDDLVAAMMRLRERGLVRALGVNSFDAEVLDHVAQHPAFDVVMADYNVLRPQRAPLIAKAARAGKGVLAGMPLAMGHTGRPWRRLKGPQDLWYAARALVHHRPEVAEGARFGFLHRLPQMTGSQAALAYVLGDPHVACAVVGTTRIAHLTENLAASGMALPPDLLARIVEAQAGLAGTERGA